MTDDNIVLDKNEAAYVFVADSSARAGDDDDGYQSDGHYGEPLESPDEPPQKGSHVKGRFKLETGAYRWHVGKVMRTHRTKRKRRWRAVIRWNREVGGKKDEQDYWWDMRNTGPVMWGCEPVPASWWNKDPWYVRVEARREGSVCPPPTQRRVLANNRIDNDDDDDDEEEDEDDDDEEEEDEDEDDDDDDGEDDSEDDSEDDDEDDDDDDDGDDDDDDGDGDGDEEEGVKISEYPPPPPLPFILLTQSTPTQTSHSVQHPCRRVSMLQSSLTLRPRASTRCTTISSLGGRSPCSWESRARSTRS